MSAFTKFLFCFALFFTVLPMDFELLNVFSGFQIGAKLNGRGDATTKLEMIRLQVRKLNFLNEMQLGDFPVSHTLLWILLKMVYV